MYLSIQSNHQILLPRIGCPGLPCRRRTFNAQQPTVASDRHREHDSDARRCAALHAGVRADSGDRKASDPAAQNSLRNRPAQSGAHGGCAPGVDGRRIHHRLARHSRAVQVGRPVRHAPAAARPKDKKAIDESTDTYDTIEWLLKNIPNNNGRVGMAGTSYGAWLTVMGMLDPHPALKAAVPQASPADMWIGDDFHHNGAFRLELRIRVRLHDGIVEGDH